VVIIPEVRDVVYVSCTCLESPHFQEMTRTDILTDLCSDTAIA